MHYQKNLTFYIIGLLLVFMTGCSGEKENDDIPGSTPGAYTELKTLDGKSFYNSGDTITFKLDLLDPIDSLKNNYFTINEDTLTTDSNTLTWLTKGKELGRYKVKTHSKINDTINESATKSVIVLADAAPVKYTFEVVNTYPHDRTAFTQGLEIENDQLYEGTGNRGASTLRLVDLKTGNVLQSKKLDDNFFGEGITIIDDKIYQISWESGHGWIYNKATFDLIAEFHYNSEGWGLTHNGTSLIMSDGSPTIYFMDKETFKITKTISVADNTQLIKDINELEYIDGEIYANVWQTNKILRIDPETGKVLGEIDMSGLSDLLESSAHDVLNGIAYDKKTKKLYVTGKYWSNLFEIKLKKVQ